MTKGRTLIAAFVLLGLGTLPLMVPVRAEQFSDRAKKIGFQLKCMCGSCSMTAAGCSHPGGEFSGPCPTAKGMLREVDEHAAKGDTDEQIVQAFAQEYGTTVYAEPPKSGFSLVAWAMPTVYLVLGALVVIFVISRWVTKNGPEPAGSTATAKAISPELLERAKKLAERETED
jgi:cytochrome c-type biogenesis protein CcmH/NrfF